MSSISPSVYKALSALIVIGSILTIALVIAYYSSLLSDRERQISILRSDLRDLELIRSYLASEVSSLRAAVHELNSSNAELRRTVSSLERENRELNRRLSSLEADNRLLSRELDRLKNIVELKLNRTLVSTNASISLEPRKNISFKYELEYSGYLLLVLDTRELNVALKIKVSGSYSGYSYSYECLVLVNVDKIKVLIPVVRGVVELAIINYSTMVVNVNSLELVYVY